MTEQKLELRSSLQLRLTQKMQQAIKLLQMSNQELSEFVATIVDANPLLEYSEEEGDGDDLDHLQEEKSTVSASEGASVEDVYSSDYENVWQDDCVQGEHSSWERAQNAGAAIDSEDYDPFYNVSHQPTLRSHILEQVRIKFGAKTLPLAEDLTEFLDETGYLPEDYEEMLTQQGYQADEIEHTLHKLQALDPAGIFARSLDECLLLQLKNRGLYTKTIELFLQALKTHQGSPDALSRKLGVSKEACVEYLALLKTLNPKPGLTFGEVHTAQVVPDILMRRRGDDWVIELNQANLPRVYLNSNYFIDLKRSLKKLDDRNYLNEKFSEGKWLLKSLHQRALNILKVADVIVRRQSAFFQKTDGKLKPLTLKEVALETELSESTVSRVTTDKYMETPRGILELKSFFSTSVGQAEDAHSAHAIQQAIRKLILHEDRNTPLSDNEIVDRLKILGIIVARRTIAKYREILKIDNAVDRKKYYAWQHSTKQMDGKVLPFAS